MNNMPVLNRKFILVGYYAAVVALAVCNFLGIISANLAVVLALVGAIFVYLPDRKNRQKAFAGMGVLLIISSLIIGWPLRYALPIRGQVLDKITGEPVENAIFEVEWYTSYASVGGASGELADKTYAVSGRDGKYRIAGRLSFPLGLGDYGLERIVHLRHPLYETAMFRDIGKIIAISDEKTHMHIRPHISLTQKDFKLMKLEDKYRTDRKAGGRDVSWILNEMIPYAIQAQKLKVMVNWQLIFTKWDRMFEQFGGDKSTTKSEIREIAGQGE